MLIWSGWVAADPTAEVTHVKGKVSVVRASSSEEIASGYVLKHGESIKTGPKSLAIVTLNEGSKLKLNENTVLLASQLDEGAATGGEVDLTLQSGSVFAKVTPRKQNKFRIHTKSATMGVRGTEFFTGLSDPSAKGSDMWMCVREGSVEVAAEDSNQTVVVEQGMGISKPAGKEISKPKAYPWTKKLNWNMNPSKGSVVNNIPLESSYLDLLKRDYD